MAERNSKLLTVAAIAATVRTGPAAKADCVTGTGGLGYCKYPQTNCTDESWQTYFHEYPVSLPTNAWSTRVTGRLLTGPNVFEETINAVSPIDAATLAAAEKRAQQAIVVAAGGRQVPIEGPTVVDSTTLPVSSFPLNQVTVTTDASSTSTWCSPPFTSGCYRACGSNTWIVHSTNIYSTLLVTGTLTSTHYELVGQSATSTLTLPIVLALPGLGGAYFNSGFVLTNRGASDARVSYVFTPAFGGAGGTAADTLAAGKQKVVSEAIPYLQGLGMPLTALTGGTLRITLSDLSAPDAAGAVVRTTTAVPGGRAGLAYAGLPASKLLSAPVYVCGLRQNDLDRSNVAVLNAGSSAEGDITLRATVVSGDPAHPKAQALPDISLSPGAFSQISGILASAGLTNGFVKVERISGTAPFYAFGVINDQATSDGSFVTPVAATPAAPIPRLTLPALVETSAYSTELVLSNLTSSPRILRFTWVSPALAGGQVSFEAPLLPGEQQIHPAVVQLLRDRGVIASAQGPSIAGALFVTDASGDLRGVFVGARVSTPGGGGRYGVFYPAVPSGSEATASAWLYGLVQNTENRTNLALVNVGSSDSSPDTFRIDLFDGGTGLKAGEVVATVPARGFVQIDRVLADYAPGTSVGYTLVTKISGSNPFLTYAVVNDGALPGERSGDGAFVEAIIPVP